MNKWLIKQALLCVIFVTGKIIIKTKWYEQQTFLKGTNVRNYCYKKNYH